MPHKFGINSPQSVKHIMPCGYISQKAFFKHALMYLKNFSFAGINILTVHRIKVKLYH